MPKKTGIIIVDYQGETETLQCLDSLAKVKAFDQVKVYVVQPEVKPNRVDHHPLKPQMITSPENRGFAWANNLGIKQATVDGCQTLVLLNNDTTVAADFLTPLRETLKDPQVGLVSPKIYFSPGREFHREEYTRIEQGKVIWYAGGVIDWQNMYASHWGVDEVDHGQFGQPVDTDFATGCGLGVTQETIKRVGLMDESYFLYWEDVDWSVRMIRAGLRVGMEPRSIIWHKNAGSTGGPGSTVHQYYQTRNRIRFANRFAPLRTRLAIWRETLRLLKSPKRIEKQAAWDAILSYGGKVKEINET